MKPLKILLGNNTLSLLAGSETWTYTLALQLKAMGHIVHCFSPDLGIIAEKLMDQGIPCFNDLNSSGITPFTFILEETYDHNYDVIIANHNNIVDHLRAQYPKTPIISTVHGIIHFFEDGVTKAPEHPALDAGVAQFVVVSEEVQEKLKNDYGIDSVIIRQPIDIKKYSNLRLPSEKPKQFLVNTNYAGRDSEEIILLREVAKHLGAKLSAVGANFSQQFDLTKSIEDSDVIFGMGRSLLEGVAAGRLGICHGRWGTGGVICEANIEEIRKQNFSGRNSGGNFATKEELIEMIEKYYNPAIMEWGKKYVTENHNIIFAAEEYVRIARELTGEAYSKPGRGDGVDPLSKPFKLATNA